MAQEEKFLVKRKSPLEAAQRTHQAQDEAGLFGSLSILGTILMRIISFYLIAKGFVTYYEGGQVDLVGFVLILLGLNAFGYGMALMPSVCRAWAPSLLGIRSSSPSLRLLAKDGQFASKRQRQMSLTSLRKGLTVWIPTIPTTWLLPCGPSSTVRLCSCWSF